MPAFTTIALATTAAAGLASTGMSIAQAEEGKRRQRRAERELDAYERQELRNVYAGMDVPTEGYELRREQLQQDVADQTAALAGAGARGLIGGLGAVQTYSARGMAQIGAELTEARGRIQQLIAQDEARIQQMMERREEQDIAGLGGEIAAGREQYYQGVQGAIGGLGTAAQAGAGLISPGGQGSQSLGRSVAPGRFEIAGMGGYAQQGAAQMPQSLTQAQYQPESLTGYTRKSGLYNQFG